MTKTYTKGLLSGSTNGRAVKVAATSSPGTTVHTAVSGTAALDAITLFAYNSDTVSRELTLQMGGTTSPDDDVKITIPSKAGRVLVIDRELLQNSLVVKAYCAAAANVITITGWVDDIA